MQTSPWAICFVLFSLAAGCTPREVYNSTNKNPGSDSPPNPTVGLVANVSGTSVSLSWAAPAGANTVMIVRYAAVPTTTAPQSGTTYTVGNTFNGGTVVVQATAGTSTAVDTLPSCAQFYYQSWVRGDNGLWSTPQQVLTSTPTAPAQPSSIQGNTLLCDGQQNVSFSVPAVGGATSYTWRFPAGVTITGGTGTNAVSVTWGTGGYGADTIGVTAVNGCGPSAETVMSTSQWDPNQSLSPIAQPSNAAPGDTQQFQFTTLAGNPVYEAQVNDGAQQAWIAATVSNSTAQHTFNNVGAYQFRVRASIPNCPATQWLTSDRFSAVGMWQQSATASHYNGIQSVVVGDDVNGVTTAIAGGNLTYDSQIGFTETILRSTDGGNTWVSMGVGNPWQINGLVWASRPASGLKNFIAVGQDALAPGLIALGGPSGTSWTKLSPTTTPPAPTECTDYPLHAVAAEPAGNGGKVVAVGENGLVCSWTNGADGAVPNAWIHRRSGTQTTPLPNLYGVKFAERIYYSNGEFRSVGDDEFVAVGAQGEILYTPDKGTTWNSHTSGVTEDLYDVATDTRNGAGNYVAVGNNATILHGTRVAGESTWAWSTVSPPAGFSASTTLRSVEWYGPSSGQGLFVATGDAGAIITSVDGVTWSNASSQTSSPVNDVAIHPNGLLAVAGEHPLEPAQSPAVMTSPDGTNWTKTMHAAAMLGMASRGSTVIAVGEDGVVMRSQDGGLNWSDTTLANGEYVFTDIVVGGTTWVIVGTGGATAVSMDDGASWTFSTIASAVDLEGVTYGNGRFIAVGVDGNIFHSTSGSSWAAAATTATTDTLRDVAYDGGLYVAVGSNGAIVTSTDASNWGANTWGSSVLLRSITVHDGIWLIAVYGSDGSFLRSTDGTTWSVAHTISGRTPISVRTVNGLFVAAGSKGYVGTSLDGIAWSETTLQPPAGFPAINTSEVTSSNGALVVGGIKSTFYRNGL